MRRFVFVVLAVALFSTASFADTIPTFNLNSASIVYTFNGPGIPNTVDYFFAGPNGVSMAGTSHSAPVCDFVIAGDTCSPEANTQPNDTGDQIFGASFGGKSYGPLFMMGAVAVSGSGFTLPGFNPPVNESTFNITVPVLFSGTFGVCPLNAALDACTSPNSLATFNVNGTGVGQLQFTLINSGPSIWTLASATYTLTPTPEPASITLFGTGIFALFGKFLGRKRPKT